MDGGSEACIAHAWRSTLVGTGRGRRSATMSSQSYEEEKKKKKFSFFVTYFRVVQEMMIHPVDSLPLLSPPLLTTK